MWKKAKGFGIETMRLALCMALGAAMECGTIDFEGMATGSTLSLITGTDADFLGKGKVAVVGSIGAVAENRAMIFNSSAPTGGDNDLRTESQGQIVILSEDGDSRDPDDSAHGGSLRFHFSGAITVESFILVDIDKPFQVFFEYNDDSEETIDRPGVGASQFGKIDVYRDDVTAMTIQFPGSGALDDLRLCVDDDFYLKGDPFIIVAGQRRQFWLPLAQWIPILSSPSYDLLAHAFGRPGSSEQWLDGVAVMNSSSNDCLFRAFLPANVPLGHAGTQDLEFLAAFVGPTRLQKDLASPDGRVVASVSKLTTTFLRGRPAEVISAKIADFLHLRITLAAATKYDSDDAITFAHLDLQLLRLTPNLSGPLIDLTQDNTTSALLQRPPALALWETGLDV